MGRHAVHSLDVGAPRVDLGLGEGVPVHADHGNVHVEGVLIQALADAPVDLDSLDGVDVAKVDLPDDTAAEGALLAVHGLRHLALALRPERALVDHGDPMADEGVHLGLGVQVGSLAALDEGDDLVASFFGRLQLRLDLLMSAAVFGFHVFEHLVAVLAGALLLNSLCQHLLVLAAQQRGALHGDALVAARAIEGARLFLLRREGREGEQQQQARHQASHSFVCVKGTERVPKDGKRVVGVFRERSLPEGQPRTLSRP
mmetsp:Transcript_1573/g.3510  ORF Transcript_1573/g.3510 Transcript_1573/m.3510 type:complete len:258 (+) Transcript_1573:2008-2781(+)